jgi:hypothetical protein
MNCAIEIPRTERLRIDDWPEVEGRVVEFRLIYKGKLPAASGHNQVSEKHKIRRDLHPQMKVLWAEHVALSGWGSSLLDMTDGSTRPPRRSDSGPIREMREEVCSAHK